MLAKARQRHFLLSIFCLAIFVVSLYLEFGMQLNPCPLCISQRFVYFGLGLVFLLYALHHPKSAAKYIYSLLVLILLTLGFWVAGRQIWLQHLPPGQTPACGPNFNVMLEIMPANQILRNLLQGTGDCAKASAKILGLALPLWSLLGYLFVLFVNTLGAWRASKSY